MKEVEIEPEYAGEDCELCSSPMVYKMGRYGKFLACSNFPDCRNTKPIVKQIGVKCPSCGEGNIVERKSKKKRVFTAVTVIRTVNSFPGTNQLNENVRNAEKCLLRKSSKKAYKSNAWNAIIRKNHRSSGEQGLAHLLCVLKEDNE